MKLEIDKALNNIKYSNINGLKNGGDKIIQHNNKLNAKSIYNPLGGATIIVASDGTGDYFSIQHAVDELDVYDQILIKSGIYEEKYIRLHGKRDYRIIGENRESVLIYGSLSINCYSVDIADISVIAKQRSDVCVNIMSGKNKIIHNKFSRARDGILVQRSNDLEMESESIIQENIFSDNGFGLWVGLHGRCIIEKNEFVNNVFGVLNAEVLSQSKEDICLQNTFNKNHRADYIEKWDYQDGTMDKFNKVINGNIVEIELPQHLNRLKDGIYQFFN